MFLIFRLSSFGQDTYIYTKEGQPILKRRQMINNCLKALNKDREDALALSVCECQVSLFDKRFSNKEFRKTSVNGIIDISILIKEDSVLQKELQYCFARSGQTNLLEAERSESDFIQSCIINIQNSSIKKLDSAKLQSFCSCQLDLIMTKKLSDNDLKTIGDPNSLLFYEVMYKCGNPFSQTEQVNWNEFSSKTIIGPIADTVNILSLNGMTYLKVKIGSLVKIWLLDTGANDIMINKEMESALKKDNIIKEENYLGIGEYELANGSIDSCRKYKVDGVQIGKYTIDNLVIAVSEKGKKIIIGKTLLNKFPRWILDNRENKLILFKL